MKTRTAIFIAIAFIAGIMLLNDFGCTVWGFTIAAALSIIGIFGHALCRSAKQGD